MLRIVLLAVGLLTLIGLIWHIGPSRIVQTVAGLGPVALLVILIPSLVMYVLEAYGWQLTLGRYRGKVSFGKVMAIRTAGEVVNMTTPMAYVGGEPLKAYLLGRYGIPLVDGLASVIVAKAIMTISQVLFILMGLGLALWILGETISSGQLWVAVIVSVGLLAVGIVGFLIIQSRGLFTGFLGALRSLRIRSGYLERRESQLRELDRSILQFYADNRRDFFLSFLAFFLGWLAEALEVYAILYCLGEPIDLLTAMCLGALSVFVKGGTFFIPGSVGAQEGGNLALLLAFGYSELTGITFALLLRVRELVWIGIGLVCLAALGGRVTPKQIEESSGAAGC